MSGVVLWRGQKKCLALSQLSGSLQSSRRKKTGKHRTVDKYKDILALRCGQRRLCVMCGTFLGLEMWLRFWRWVEEELCKHVEAGRRKEVEMSKDSFLWVRWQRIMRLKKLDSCWKTLLFAGGTVSRGGGAEGRYRRGSFLLIDPPLLVCSCTPKLGN